jgi:hypothetical protein
MTVYTSPERAMLATFDTDPDFWRPTLIAFLHIGLSDLVDFCAEWYGTDPSPITSTGFAGWETS